MEKKILGLDLGTNSIGWAVVNDLDNSTFQLKDEGIHIFQEGVKIEEGKESSKAGERTQYRSARKLKFRRKLRKIETLKVLIAHDFCPELSRDELQLWRNKRVYPKNPLFIEWWKTDDQNQKNPYFYRAEAVERRLNLNNQNDRYRLGRAFYHLSQRRGFLSNRLASSKENEGIVKYTIEKLQEKKAGKTLGQYFWESINQGRKVRTWITHREKDYLDEFNRICAFQQLEEDVVQQLRKAIFFQRPLKSQKNLVGKCPFEKNKRRCAISHPSYEEFRMLCFVNNIKIKTPKDQQLRFLVEDERKIVMSKFDLLKDHFDFGVLVEKLDPKK